MSGYSSVDDSPDPARLVAFLDHAAAAESGMKHYALAAHALREPRAPILDVGCGAGHDLRLLAGAGMAAVGVDRSAVMLAAASRRLDGVAVRLVQGAGEGLPFRSGSCAGCRMERVLMHVADPTTLLAEAWRCLRPGGLLTVFEPDWSRLEVRSDIAGPTAGWLSGVRHPDVGGRLWRLVEEAGFDVLDRVEELSVWRSLETLERVAGFPAAVDRSVAAGRLDQHTARRWVAEQQRRDRAGEFYALLPKIQIVSARR